MRSAVLLMCTVLVATCNGGNYGPDPGTLDHVGIAVRNLDTATATYENTLGLLHAQRTRLPNGIERAVSGPEGQPGSLSLCIHNRFISCPSLLEREAR